MRKKTRNPHLLNNTYGAKPILDLETGNLYHSIDSLAKLMGIKSNTMCKRVTRQKDRYVKMNQKQAENYARKIKNATFDIRLSRNLCPSSK